MAEQLIDLRKEPKARAYATLHALAASTLVGVDDEIVMMATIASLVHHAFGFLWTGFYRVATPTMLRVGPYQGTVGCLDIEIGKGVCGTAARERRTIIVTDVERFPGHITCDPRSRSEIVVPVFAASGALIAVFDVDSDRPARFDEEDREGLERLLTLFRQLPSPT
ncbi:MAG TPA: GAF domain-containing protein [Gemmatimonadaceae bacterium]|jgi:GAF domain-containing protein